MPLELPHALVVEARKPARLGVVLERDRARELVAEPGMDARLGGQRRGALARAHAPDQRVQPVPRGYRHPTRAARVAVELAGAERLPEGLAEVAPDAHRLAHRLHLRGQRAVGARELLEREAGRLHDDVVDRRLERGRRRAGDVVRDLVERVADGEAGRHLRDRVARRLRRERRAARDPRVHLDHDELARLAVERELHVRAPGLHSHDADDRGCGVAQRLVLAVGERHRRRDADRVAGVDAHRIDVLDRADDHHVVEAVADHLELELAPALDRLLEQHLRDRALAQPARDRVEERGLVAREPAAMAPERERRADHHRRLEPGRERGLGVGERADDRRARHAEADRGHRGGERLAILGAVDRVTRRADQLDPELVEHARLGERDRQVQGRLTTERGKQRVGALPTQHRRDALEVERLEVGAVGPARVGHDRRRVRVDEHRAVALLAQHLQRLRARSSRTRRPGRSRSGPTRSRRSCGGRLVAASLGLHSRALAHARANLDEALELDPRVVRTRGRLGVELHAPHGPAAELQPLDGVVVERDVRHVDLGRARPRRARARRSRGSGS